MTDISSRYTPAQWAEITALRFDAARTAEVIVQAALRERPVSIFREVLAHEQAVAKLREKMGDAG